MSDPASVYVEAADLRAYLRANRLGQLVNDDGSDNDEATDAVKTLNEQLWRTERVVHGLIGSVYFCPQDETSSPLAFGAIAEGILAMTVYRLFARGLIAGSAAADLKTAHDKASDYFERIHSGTGSLPADAKLAVLKEATISASSFFGSETKLYGDPEAS